MTPLTHGSFFSGIGGFDLGFERSGWTSVFYSEVKPFSVAIHETHFPDVPNLGDLNAICPTLVGPAHACEIPAATVWTGGFPCSDLSTMGHRKGLHEGDRSSLALVWLDLADRHRPEWVVLENVPGLLTSGEGRDLAVLLGTLEDLGYGWAYRLLDARDFGLPQARRRVFIVAGPTANAAGAVLDDATDRVLDHETRRAPWRAALAGGQGRADPVRGTVVVGPTYGRFGEGIQRRGDVYTITPSNPQYVVERDEPYVVSQHGMLQVVQRRPGAGAATIVAHHHLQWVVERERRDDVGRVVRGGRGSRRGEADAGRRDDPVLGLAAPATLAEGGADSRETADADGVRAAPGTARRLDDPESGGDTEVGDERLDNPRWHVLGRTLPVPIAHWIGAGLATVVRRLDEQPDAFADG